MPRILIDGQIFSIHKRSGIGRVFSSIYQEYLETFDSRDSSTKISLGVFATTYMDVPKNNKHVAPIYLRGIFRSSKIALILN